MPTTLRRLISLAAALGASAAIALAAPRAGAAEPAGEGENPPPGMVGFELGDFRLRDYRPIQAEKVRITFTLHAAVASEGADRFERLLEPCRMRVRDQVITAMRLADPEEFQDPELRLIRRRLLIRLRRTVPKLPIEEVFFSDFRYLIK